MVPAILEGTTEVKPDGDTLAKFLVDQRRAAPKNNAKIASFAAQTAPELLWRGVVFHPFTNTAVESAFADHRTYIYKGKEVDQQVHLGFDLASFAGTPIVAANRGKVLFADELGIYGNCVILDHGMGVQSLYAHLSSIDVKPGETVEKEQQLGRSGMTGMAGGDHLHFTMLVNGKMVNPVEWWDPHWIEDRILRKLRGPGGTPEGQPVVQIVVVSPRSIVGSRVLAWCLSGGLRAHGKRPADPPPPTPSVSTPRRRECRRAVSPSTDRPRTPAIKMGGDPGLRRAQGRRDARDRSSARTAASATCSSTSRTASASTISTCRPSR